MRLRSAKSSSEISNSDPAVSESAVQAAESQVESSQLVGNAGTATGNKNSKRPVVSELAVQAAESQVKSSPLVGKAGTATGNKKSKVPTVSELAVQAAEPQVKSVGKAYSSAFDFDGDSVEKADVQIQKKKRKDKGKNVSKGKVAAVATTPVTSVKKHQAKLTTPATSASKYKGKAKPIQFDLDAAYFDIDESKPAVGIEHAKAKAKLFDLDVDAAFVKQDVTRADVIISQVDVNSLLVNTDNAASVNKDEKKPTNVIDMQVVVNLPYVNNDESRSSNVNAETIAHVDEDERKKTQSAEIIAQVDEDVANDEDWQTAEEVTTDNEDKSFEQIAADGIAEEVTTDNEDKSFDQIAADGIAEEVTTDNEDKSFEQIAADGIAEEVTTDNEDKSFEQIAADGILMMSDANDALTGSVCGLEGKDLVDLVLSSDDNLPTFDDVMFVYPFVGGQAIENAAKGLFLFHDSYCTPSVLMHLQKQACQPKKFSVAVTKQDRQRLLDNGWLNDNLINFWLLWVTRMESHPDSTILTMSTYFYSKLANEGVDSAMKWTTKSNVLSKKLVFIPIHKDQHWSLMVIVNACLVDHFDECDTVSEVPCMLHLDGLALHNRKEIADNLRLWLNAEWRKNKTSNANVFTTLTMDSFSLSGEPTV
jgi:hypothetical protein